MTFLVLFSQSGVSVSCSATLNASIDLIASAVKVTQASSSLNASTSLTASAFKITQASSNLDVSANLIAVSSKITQASSNLDVSVGLASTAFKVTQASSSLNTFTGLTVSAFKVTQASSSLDASINLIASAFTTTQFSLFFTGNGTAALTASAFKITQASSSLDASVGLTAIALDSKQLIIILSATSDLVAASLKIAMPLETFVATTGLTASLLSKVQSSANFAASGTLTASTLIVLNDISTLYADATLAASALKIVRPTINFTAAASLTASLLNKAQISTKFDASGNLTASTKLFGIVGGVTLAPQGAFSVDAFLGKYFTSAILKATAALTTSAAKIVQPNIILAASGSLFVSTRGPWYTTCRFAADSSLYVRTGGTWYTIEKFAAAGSLKAIAIAPEHGSALFKTSGSLAAHSSQIWTQGTVAALHCSANLSVRPTYFFNTGARFAGKGSFKSRMVGPWHIAPITFNARGYWWPYIARFYAIDKTISLVGSLDAIASVAYIMSREYRNDTVMRADSSLKCEASSLYLFTDPINLGIHTNSGERLLYQTATGLEKAMADVDAYRLTATYAELIRDQWDPYRIFENNLPYLAWAMGANLWESTWTTDAKRDWTNTQWKFKSLRGTPEAFNRALAPSGYEVVDMVRPPQGFWASPDMTKEEWDVWIRQMPELRIFYQDREGSRGLDELFIDNEDAYTPGVLSIANTGFAVQDAVPLDDGFVLRGRYAVVRHNGVDTPVYSINYTPETVTVGTWDYERLSTVGSMPIGFASDDDVVDDLRFVDFEVSVPKIYTLHLNRSYEKEELELSLTTVVPDLIPVIPRYEQDSDIGYGGVWSFSDTFADDYQFADHEDGGGRLLADRIYFLDPDVVEPMLQGISFSDVSRVGIPSYYGELQIDLHGKEKITSSFCNDYFVEYEMFTAPEDVEPIERAFRATNDAKALRDTIAVSFAPVRTLAMGDLLKPTTAYSDWIREGL